MVRTFICMEIPDEIRAAIDKNVIKPLRKCDIRCSWVKPENLHLTLKFLGDVPETKLGRIGDAVCRVTEGIAPPKVSLARVGTFGKRSPKVVLVNISCETDTLNLIAKIIDTSMHKFGFTKEKRIYSPHLTIGRIRSPLGTDTLMRKIGELSLPAMEFSLDNMILMRSELSPQGSIYTPVRIFNLA